jgi:hypothetical protein
VYIFIAIRYPLLTGSSTRVVSQRTIATHTAIDIIDIDYQSQLQDHPLRPIVNPHPFCASTHNNHSSMLGSKVPSELTDTIIDCLREDKLALAKCSTVCKSWLTRSRYHFFEHIFLSYKDRRGTRALFALCDSSLSTIIPNIRSLHLIEGAAPSDRWLIDVSAKLAMFSAVESLTIENATFPHMDSRMIFPNFPMLKQLRLFGAYFRSSAQLVHVFGACPLLEHISLDNLQYWNRLYLQQSSIDPQPPLRLRNLELGACDKVAVIDCLLAGQGVIALTKFRATCLVLDEIASVGALLRTVAPSLKHLELGSDRAFWDDSDRAHFIGT